MEALSLLGSFRCLKQNFPQGDGVLGLAFLRSLTLLFCVIYNDCTYA